MKYFMKVSKINLFFRKLGESQIKHRKLCLIILIAWTLICLSGMRNFHSESSNSDWIVNGSETVEMAKGEVCVFRNNNYATAMTYEAGANFVFKNLQMPTNYFQELLSKYFTDQNITNPAESGP